MHIHTFKVSSYFYLIIRHLSLLAHSYTRLHCIFNNVLLIFLVFTVTICYMNVLIAMMSQSYEKITETATVEAIQNIAKVRPQSRYPLLDPVELPSP